MSVDADPHGDVRDETISAESDVHGLSAEVKDTVKVVQFAGAVLETAAYHHGDTALQGAIIAMARRYCGSNNINLLLLLAAGCCLAAAWQAGRQAGWLADWLAGCWLAMTL